MVPALADPPNDLISAAIAGGNARSNQNRAVIDATKTRPPCRQFTPNAVTHARNPHHGNSKLVT
jgi:hypothetical protein